MLALSKVVSCVVGNVCISSLKFFFPEGAEGCPRAWRERSLGAILCPGPVYPASALADNSPILRVADYYLK